MIISLIPLDSFILAWNSLVSGIGTKSSSNGFQFDKTTLQVFKSVREYLWMFLKCISKYYERVSLVQYVLQGNISPFSVQVSFCQTFDSRNTFLAVISYQDVFLAGQRKDSCKSEKKPFSKLKKKSSILLHVLLQILNTLCVSFLSKLINSSSIE